MMGGDRRQVTRNHQGISLHVRLVARDAAVLRHEMDVVGADLLPNLLGVIGWPVAVEVAEVTVDLVQVPLLKAGWGEEEGPKDQTGSREGEEEDRGGE